MGEVLVEITPVVVILGASSGIGRATALKLAAGGNTLILCARDVGALEETRRACLDAGASDVDAIALDLRDPAAVQDAADQALARHGRFDVWVNCAAVLAFGRFEEIPPDSFAGVVETNVLGYANGARAALRHFRSRGEGTLIIVGSVLSRIPEPFVSPYVTSKYAIDGMTSCIRQENRDLRNVHVCFITPFAIDTPIYQRASNFFGRRPRSIAPVYDASTAARQIVKTIDRPKREVRVGAAAWLALFAMRVSKRLTEGLVAAIAPRLQFEGEKSSDRSGALLSPKDNVHAVGGGWKRYWLSLLRGAKRRGPEK